MEREKDQRYVKVASSLGTPKSTAEATENSANTTQSLWRKAECKIVGDTSALTVRKHTGQETRKYLENI